MKKYLLASIICSFSLIANSQGWAEVKKVTASDRASQAYFGKYCAISGKKAVVGANDESKDSLGLNPLTSAGAAYIYEQDISGNWYQIQKIVNSDRNVYDYFANSVSISGDYMIIAAAFEDEDEFGLNSMTNAGSAYIYERDIFGHWNEVQKIVASDRTMGDNFGTTVSISGDYAIVGAPIESEDEFGNNTKTLAGSAYIFERNSSGVWNQVKKIVASDRTASDRFGQSLAISGNKIVVGAYTEDHDEFGNNYLADPGSAYIFERDTFGIWSEVKKIVASDRASNDNFGKKVAISGDYIIVGAEYEDEDTFGLNTMIYAGSAYIFERNSSGIWSQVQKIVAADRSANDYFGAAVSISGNYALIGAVNEYEDSIGNNTVPGAGSAYLFERNVNGNWMQSQKIVASDRGTNNDNFGCSSGISGGNLIIGAWRDAEDSLSLNPIFDAGSAYIFNTNFIQPEIAVKANNIEIIDGDTLPSVLDETNFGKNCNGGTISKTFVITNTGNFNLNLTGNPKVDITGVNASDFTIISQPTSSIGVNDSSTFVVEFSPSTIGVKKAMISIVNNDSDENPYQFSIQAESDSLTANYSYIDNGSGNFSFTNTSLGTYNQSHWAFGDGNTSIMQNANHTFTTNGNFVVVLTVNDSTLNGTCFNYFNNTINVFGVSNPLQCTSGFVMYPDTISSNVIVVNNSTGVNLTYLWDFGDGDTSTLQNPTHVYATAGPYYLCLTVDDGASCIDMYCDSIGKNGVVFKQAGFTINVISPPIITEISDVKISNSVLEIHPNPANIDLTFVTDLIITSIIILDVSGKEVKSVIPQTNKIKINDLTNGIYFLKIVGKGQIVVRKFVKQ